MSPLKHPKRMTSLQLFLEIDTAIQDCYKKSRFFNSLISCTCWRMSCGNKFLFHVIGQATSCPRTFLHIDQESSCDTQTQTTTVDRMCGTNGWYLWSRQSSFWEIVVSRIWLLAKAHMIRHTTSLFLWRGRCNSFSLVVTYPQYCTWCSSCGQSLLMRTLFWW